MNWGWPQWVFLVLYAYTAVNATIKGFRAKASSEAITVALFIVWGIIIGEAVVLHAGGFW